MLRLFDTHEVRSADTLDGVWDFTTAADRTDRRKLPADYPRKILVPSGWEQIPGLENYRGRGWLRTTVCGREGKALRLVFGGVSHTGTVYVDGKEYGGHYDAFTPWDVVIPGLGSGSHELVVEVDNTFGEHSGLHKENDYYTYGGITRPVEAQWVPEVYIDRVFATPVRRGGTWRLDVRLLLRTWGAQAVSRRVTLQLDGTECDLGECTIEPGPATEVRGRITDLDVEPWSPADPKLYFLRAALLDGKETVDDCIDRVGFREIKCRGRKILLNGEPIRLRGYNRHEDHGQFGCAIPPEAMACDLHILRDLGCNFVRTCHYPNDMRFLDLCDEMGFAVWEESHARQVDFDHPRCVEQLLVNTREMVEWHWNRPSILMWGSLNECESDTPRGRKVHADVLGLIKELDPHRPVTFASNKQKRDRCLDLVDIVSWNRYDAWYGGAVDNIEPAIKDAFKWLASDASGGKGKPVIMSEFGAGAIPGWRNPNRQRWTEEYQCDVLDESLRVYLNHKNISGVAIWQYCDCRITGGLWNRRPRTMNNKGTVDEHRRRKLAYDVVRRRMHEAIERWEKTPR